MSPRRRGLLSPHPGMLPNFLESLRTLLGGYGGGGGGILDHSALVGLDDPDDHDAVHPGIDQAETITGPWDLEDGSVVEVGSTPPSHRDGKLWFDPDAGPEIQPPSGHGSTHENEGTDEFSLAGLSGELADPQPPKTHKTSHHSGGADPLDVKNIVDSEGRLLTGVQKTDLTDGGVTTLHEHEETVSHIHAYKEDKSKECDGAKTVFITAQQFEPYTLRIMLNGLEKLDGAAEDYEEGVMYDSFVMAAAPTGGDTLIAHYLAQKTA